MSPRSRGHHPPCPGGCNELADECACPTPNPLGSMVITQYPTRPRAVSATCVCCGRHWAEPDAKVDTGPIHFTCWDRHHSDPNDVHGCPADTTPVDDTALCDPPARYSGDSKVAATYHPQQQPPQLAPSAPTRHTGEAVPTRDTRTQSTLDAIEQDRRRDRYARAITKDAAAPMTGTADAVIAVADAEQERLRQWKREATDAQIEELMQQLADEETRA